MWSKRPTPVVLAIRWPRPKAKRQLDVGPGEGLVHDVAAPAGVGDDLRVADRVTVQEDALARHLDVVEDGDGVHLVEARGQRIVEARAALGVGVAADELEPGRAHGDGEGERVAAVLGADVRARVDGQLVGVGGERGQHAGAADDDPGLGVGDLVQRHLARRLLGLRLGAVDLRVHDRVGGGQVAVAHQLLVGDDVGRPLLVAAPRPHVGPAGEAGEGHVQVVGRAPHQAGGGRRGQLHRPPPPLQIVLGARDQVGDVDQPAVVGRRRQHLVGVLVLEVVHGRQRAGGRLQLRVVERMGDLLAAQPDLAGVAAQALQELLAGAGGDRSLGGCHQDVTSSGGSLCPRISRPSRS